MALKMTVGNTVVAEMAEPKPVHQPKVVQAEVSELDAKVNELISLQTVYEQFEMKKTVDRIAALKKELVEIANQEGVDGEPYIFKTDVGEVEFGKRSSTTVITKPVSLLDHLNDKFGTIALASVVKFGITDLKKILSENELMEFAKIEPASRSLKEVRPAA